MTERTPEETAVEFGGYLADAAELLMDRIEKSWPEAVDGGDFDDEWLWLRRAVYEFRKRREKCSLGSQKAS